MSLGSAHVPGCWAAMGRGKKMPRPMAMNPGSEILRHRVSNARDRHAHPTALPASALRRPLLPSSSPHATSKQQRRKEKKETGEEGGALVGQTGFLSFTAGLLSCSVSSALRSLQRPLAPRPLPCPGLGSKSSNRPGQGQAKRQGTPYLQLGLNLPRFPPG